MTNKFLQYSFFLASLLFFCSILLPNHVSPWQAFYHEYLAVLSLMVLFLCVIVVQPKLYFTPVLIVLLFVSIVPLVQFFFGVIFFGGDACLAFFYLFGAAIAFFCGNHLAISHRNKSFFYLFSVFFVLGVFSAYFVLYQFFQLDYLGLWVIESLPTARPYGNLAQPNNMASLLVLSFLSAWYLFEKGVFSRKVFWLVAIYFCMALALTQSRTTVLVGVAVFVWYFISVNKIPFFIRWFELLLVAIVYFLCHFFFSYAQDLLVVDSVIRELSVIDDARLAIWQDIIYALFNGPLWGYGWNQVSVAQVLSNSGLDRVIYVESSHNLFLDLLIFNGPILGGLLIVAVVYWAWLSFKSCRSFECWVALAIIGAIFTHASLEYPLNYAYFLLPVFFLVGLIDSSKPLLLIGGACRVCQLRLFSGGFIILLSIAVLVIIFRDYQVIAQNYRQMIFANAGFISESKKVSEAPNVILLTQMREHILLGRTEAKPNMSSEKLEWMKQVSHRYPQPGALYTYAEASYLNGQEKEAQRVLAVVSKLYGKKLRDSYSYKLFGR